MVVCLILNEGHKLRAVRRIFGPKWEEDVTRTWIELHRTSFCVSCWYVDQLQEDALCVAFSASI